MATPTYDFTWEQGEDGLIALVYKKPATVGAQPTPVDLTGWKLRMDVRDEAGALLFVFNSDDVTDTLAAGGPVDNVGAADNEAVLGSAGQINITVPRTASLGDGALASKIGRVLKYDVFLRSAANKQFKLLKGTITIQESVTKWT